jgi:hypothetical protein
MHACATICLLTGFVASVGDECPVARSKYIRDNEQKKHTHTKKKHENFIRLLTPPSRFFFLTKTQLLASLFISVARVTDPLETNK